MFICEECKKKCRDTMSVFSGKNWCRKCYDAENKRSKKEDAAPGTVGGIACYRTRPPKYMLSADQYEEFGYTKTGI